MILINDNWEYVNNLEDVLKIIREQYNYELADKLEELLPDYTEEDYWALESELADKEDEIMNLEDEIDKLEDTIEKLEEKIKEFKE